ncbi:MAG: hypothetical protein WDM94_07900 [Bauldia sp.]
MGTDLVVARRAQLAGYAGFAGAIRGRARPIAVIAAVDVLAVALAFGAIHLTGMMVGGSNIPQLIPPVSAATEPVAATTPLVPPTRRLVPAPRALAAMPDAAVMFARPVAMIDRGFTFAAPSSSSSSFETPPAAVAAVEPAPPVAAPTPVPTPRLRPLERVAAIATPVIDAADGSLDRLLLRDVVPAVGTSVAQTGNALRQTTTGAEGAVSAAVASTATVVAPVTATVQTMAQNVTQPVASVVQSVAGLLR